MGQINPRFACTHRQLTSTRFQRSAACVEGETGRTEDAMMDFMTMLIKLVQI